MENQNRIYDLEERTAVYARKCERFLFETAKEYCKH